MESNGIIEISYGIVVDVASIDGDIGLLIDSWRRVSSGDIEISGITVTSIIVIAVGIYVESGISLDGRVRIIIDKKPVLTILVEVDEIIECLLSVIGGSEIVRSVTKRVIA